MLKRELAGLCGVDGDVAVAELRKQSLQRIGEPIEDADAVAKGNEAIPLRTDMVLPDRGTALRWRMNEEGGPPGDVGAKKADALIGSIPALDYDEIKFFAKKLIDHGAVLPFDFEEVGEGADGGKVGGLRLRSSAGGAEDVFDGVGRVAVVSDQAFQRAATAVERCELPAQLIPATFGLGLLFSASFGVEAKGGDLGLKAAETLGYGLKGEAHLAALHAKAGEFFAGDIGFAGEALGLLV